MSAQAILDESARRSGCHVCVAVIADGDMNVQRQVVRSFYLPSQRRWHLVNERDSCRRRRRIIDAWVGSGQVSALAYCGGGRDTGIRAECVCRMVAVLLERGVTRLVIESREGRDDMDRGVLIDELRGHGGAAFGCDRMPPRGDPLLWIADALAWCSSAGGAWRDRIESISTEFDVTGR